MEISSILFAAGRGRRLRPLTDTVPKPALEVGGVPLAAWNLAKLIRDVPPVVVNASHLASVLMKALESLGLPDWEPFVEPPPALGTAGTLRALRDRVGERVLTCNGDLITGLQPAELLEAHRLTSAPATVAVRMIDVDADLRVEDGSVTGFLDRRKGSGAGAQFLGMAVFERESLDLLPDAVPSGLGETLLRTLAERGELAAYVYEGYWRDVGTIEAYEQVRREVAEGRAPPPPVKRT